MLVSKTMRSTMLTLALILAAGAAIADTPSRTVFDAWLEAFNSGDRAKILAFLERWAPQRAQAIDQEVQFREQTGGFDLVRVTKEEATVLEALLKERAGGTYANLTLRLSADDPPKIAGIGLRMTEPPPDLVPAALSDAELVGLVTKEVDAQAAADRFAGAVMVAHNGKPLLEKAWGLADREKGMKNTVDTRFRIGSMNKMFTSVATLQLVGKGKLSLDGTIADYWPDYPNKELASKVKVRYLLSHMGGTGDIFGPEFDQHRLELRTLEDYAELYGSRALKFEPGSRFDYSNYGFLLLGLLIEKVSGESYYDYVRKHIFEPAGMTRTDSLPETEAVDKRSVGYMKRGGNWEPNTDTLPWRGTSAGGGYSTVGDLLRFAQALESGKILDRKLLAEATKSQSDAGYGFGFQARATSYGHGGGAPGMNGELRIYPTTGYVVAVLANLDPPAASRIASLIEPRLPKK